ncbi:MAG: AAA family ATPase [Desulfobulbus propionicus]|nr:MAG: AAA family ATPase [Desulfobulbus propionicus]
MYTKYYGLTKKPFDLIPDPEVVYMSETHKEAFAILKYGVISKKSFLVLTAEVGIGKTTLLQALLDTIDVGIRVCMINNPLLKRDEFFSYISEQFELPWDGNKAMFLLEFERYLQLCYQRNERVLLIIDEAQVLPVDLLEEVRLLSNMDVEGQDVLSIFLVGQPELNDQMRDERLLPLRQRIGIRFHLSLFNQEETKQYILFRLRAAGSRQLYIFTDEAMAVIHRVSKGTPRLINIVCDHALISGFADSKPTISAELVEECIAELHFPGEGDDLPLPQHLRKKSWKRLGGWITGVLVVVVLLFFALQLLP